MNFATCRPQKTGLRLHIKIPQSDELDETLDTKGIDVLDYEKKWGVYRLKLNADKISEHREFLKSLLMDARNLRK